MKAECKIKILKLLVFNCCSYDSICRIVVVMKILFIEILVNIFLWLLLCYKLYKFIGDILVLKIMEINGWKFWVLRYVENGCFKIIYIIRNK